MTRNGCIMTLLLIVSSFSMELEAQENLDALVKKCETMKSVEMQVIRTKNEQTKKLEVEMIKITINEDQELINEFFAAFKKDEDKVQQVIEKKQGKQRKIMSLLYYFEKAMYKLSEDEKAGCATVYISYN